jgi:hypothetical protein
MLRKMDIDEKKFFTQMIKDPENMPGDFSLYNIKNILNQKFRE